MGSVTCYCSPCGRGPSEALPQLLIWSLINFYRLGEGQEPWLISIKVGQQRAKRVLLKDTENDSNVNKVWCLLPRVPGFSVLRFEKNLGSFIKWTSLPSEAFIFTSESVGNRIMLKKKKSTTAGFLSYSLITLSLLSPHYWVQRAELDRVRRQVYNQYLPTGQCKSLWLWVQGRMDR